MQTETETPPIINDTQGMQSEIERFSKRTVPTFFHLGARLPIRGRTNQVCAATQHMSIVLKTYASGGENGLHAHVNEDHVFIVLQGGATFYGPRGESKRVSKNDCVLIPRLAHYWFAADEGGEALVLLRIGAAVGELNDVFARVHEDGRPFDPSSEENKPVELELSDRWFG